VDRDRTPQPQFCVLRRDIVDSQADRAVTSLSGLYIPPTDGKFATNSSSEAAMRENGGLSFDAAAVLVWSCRRSPQSSVATSLGRPDRGTHPSVNRSPSDTLVHDESHSTMTIATGLSSGSPMPPAAGQGASIAPTAKAIAASEVRS
jgi:hypothetical protein